MAQSTPHPAPSADALFEKDVRPVLVKNCQPCHNAKTHTAQLDLSTASGFRSGGQSGPLVTADHPETSRLLRVISYDESLKMPPQGKLTSEEIASITEWVKLGAPWPDSGSAVISPVPSKKPREFTPEQKQFWAFQPVKPQQPPAVGNRAWVRTPVDAFILAGLEKSNLQPASPASKTTLLRRVTYDLTGLPPTPEEIQNFITDSSPDAFRAVVDRLLASPRYGERWGRHWLDVARYADSTGNDEDHRYPYAWRYRDYVIDSFNQDLRYDRFIREQIAGDLLPPPAGAEINRNGLVATGFLALGAKAIAQQDKKKMLYDIYDEQVEVTSKAFLGLTVACARCHDHKFDPILTKDYYSLVSMFASTQQFSKADEHVSELLYTPLVPKAQYDVYKAHQDKLAGMRIAIDAEVTEEVMNRLRSESDHIPEYMLTARLIVDGKLTVKDALATSPRNPMFLMKWTRYLKEGGKAHPQLIEWDNAPESKRAEVAAAYQRRFQSRLTEWTKTLDAWRGKVRESLDKNLLPPSKPTLKASVDQFFFEVIQDGPFSVDFRDRDKLLSPELLTRVTAQRKDMESFRTSGPSEPDMACAVREGTPVDQKVFIRGDYNSPGEDAPKTFPRILSSPADPKVESGSGRLQLAEWISNPKNPLTARVMVNRVWQWHFGEGLVRTPDNFGKMGDRPSHPELLDYLAAEFVKSGWSVKSLHRMIVLSNAYQMSSDADAKTLEADPENRLLSRYNRQRLDIEEIRDSMLAISGAIDLTMGGSLQRGFGTDGENSADRLSVDPGKLKRRSVYVPLRRANLPTLLNLFDFGDATSVNGKRIVTNVASQALFTMNSEFVIEQSNKLADSLFTAEKTTADERLNSAYLRILNRQPEASEMAAARDYLQSYAAKFAGANSDRDAWRSYCHLLLASNEFLYLD